MAVAQQSLPMVRILDKYGADGRIKNIDEVCPLDIAVSENIRDIKLFMMGRSSYKSYNFGPGGSI